MLLPSRAARPALFVLAAALAPAVAATLSGIDAVKFLYRRGEFGQAKGACQAMLWDNIRQAEPLWYLAASFDKLGNKDQAAVLYYIDFFAEPPAAP